MNNVYMNKVLYIFCIVLTFILPFNLQHLLIATNPLLALKYLVIYLIIIFISLVIISFLVGII